MGVLDDELRRRESQHQENEQRLKDGRTQYRKNLEEFRNLMVARSVSPDHSYHLKVTRRDVPVKPGFLMPAKEPGYQLFTCDFSPGVSGWIVTWDSDSETGDASGTILTEDLRVYQWKKFHEESTSYSPKRFEYPGLRAHQVKTPQWAFGKYGVMVLGDEVKDPYSVDNDAGLSRLAQSAEFYFRCMPL